MGQHLRHPFEDSLVDLSLIFEMEHPCDPTPIYPYVVLRDRLTADHKEVNSHEMPTKTA